MTFARERQEWLERREAEREARRQVLCKPGPARGVYAPVSQAVNAAPKGQQCKPGKRTPTKDEAAWMDAITAYGCIACRMEGRGFVPAAVHHILSGGVRVGHLFTLPLCDPGHHQQGHTMGLVSRHPWKARFEALYGDEWALLASLQAVLKVKPDGSYAE